MKALSLGALALTACAVCVGPAAAQTFNQGTGGPFTWNSASNWTPAAVPNGAGAAATFNVTGTLGVTLDAAITAGSITVNNSVNNVFTLSNGTGGSITFANSGSEAALVLNGTSTTTNNLTISASLSLTDTLRVTVNNTVASAALTSSPLTFTGAITGSGGFIKDGPGRLSFTTATKDYTGATVINQGRIRVTLPGLPTQTSSVMVNAGGQLNVDGGSTNTTFAFGGGTAVITINGAGESQTNLPGALRNEGTGTVTTILSNPVVLGSDATIHVDGSPRTFQLDGSVSGSAVLTKTGLGNLVLTQANTSLTGGTVIREGIITVNAGSQIGTGPLTLSQNATRDTTLTLNNAAQSIGNLSTVFADATGTRAQTINLNGTALSVTQTANTTFGNGAVGTLTGVIAGTGSLTMTAASTGTLMLTGTNTYTGTTTIHGGTLLIGTGGSLAAGSAVAVNSGGTLGGTGTVNGAVTVTGGRFRGGDANGVGTLTLAGGLTLGTGAQTVYRITDGSTPSSTPGGSTIGAPPNPTSNNFVNVTAGGLTVAPGDISTLQFVIDGTGTSFVLGQPYSYRVAQVFVTTGTPQNLVTIQLSGPAVQGMFSTIGFQAENFSLSGDTGGFLYVGFTPVPEPAIVFGLAAAGLSLGAFVRRW